jgi:hypothetical protein
MSDDDDNYEPIDNDYDYDNEASIACRGCLNCGQCEDCIERSIVAAEEQTNNPDSIDTRPLLPWLVNDGDEDCSTRWLAWAPDAEAACRVCRGWADCPEMLEAVPCEQLAGRQESPGKPYVSADDEELRLCNFRSESDSSCDTCGLFEMDGKYPVCDGCNQCEECGCDCEEDGE